MSVFSVKHLTGWILCFESELYCVFFTRFLTSLRIWEGYSTYKDAQDYAENACSSSERYTGKKKGCVLALMLSVCTQHHYVCPTSASSRDYFIFGSDRVVGTRLSSWFGRDFPVGSPHQWWWHFWDLALLNFWPRWESLSKSHELFYFDLLCLCTELVSSNLNFAGKSISIEMSNSCW